MADHLREKLRALVEEWSTPWGSSPALYARYLTASTFADQLSALLAESEPEPSFSDVTATRCLRHATIPPTILPPASQECGLCMREEGVLVGRSEQRPEIAWLIESRLTPSPTWWTGADWTPDSLKAVRFCRKQDAEAALATLPDKHVCFTSEHQWGFGGESDTEPGLVKCDDCGALVPETQDGRSLRHRCNGPRPDCEAKAKLPLGHEYNDYGCKVRPCRGLCHVHGCGQPRSAHEPK